MLATLQISRNIIVVIVKSIAFVASDVLTFILSWIRFLVRNLHAALKYTHVIAYIAIDLERR